MSHPAAHSLLAHALSPTQAIFGLLDLLARWVADRLAAAKDAALTAAVQKGGTKWVPAALLRPECQCQAAAGADVSDQMHADCCGTECSPVSHQMAPVARCCPCDAAASAAAI